MYNQTTSHMSTCPLSWLLINFQCFHKTSISLSKFTLSVALQRVGWGSARRTWETPPASQRLFKMPTWAWCHYQCVAWLIFRTGWRYMARSCTWMMHWQTLQMHQQRNGIHRNWHTITCDLYHTELCTPHNHLHDTISDNSKIHTSTTWRVHPLSSLKGWHSMNWPSTSSGDATASVLIREMAI